MKKKGLYAALTAIGAALLILGGVLIKTSGLSTLPYLLIGCGAGCLGHGTGELINMRMRKKSPDWAKAQEIEENDERNLALRDKAQAGAYRLSLPVYGALFMALALMDAEIKVLLLLIAAYLFICGSSVYYRIKYEKEM